MPRSLGVHPLLTITALAERAMIHLARRHGLTFSVAPARGAPRELYAGKGRKPKQPGFFGRLVQGGFSPLPLGRGLGEGAFLHVSPCQGPQKHPLTWKINNLA